MVRETTRSALAVPKGNVCPICQRADRRLSLFQTPRLRSRRPQSRFGKRSGANAVFAKPRASRAGATARQVAAAIFAAATDGADQIRYIGAEEIKPLVAARRETSEAEHVALMRGRTSARACRGAPTKEATARRMHPAGAERDSHNVYYGTKIAGDATILQGSRGRA
jgi:hypothetical protein